MIKNIALLSEVPPSPLQRLRSPQLEAAQVVCWVKRDDLLRLPVLGNPFAFSGNKWRKLKYNLTKAKQVGSTQLLTFGGAFSNHIAAVAAAGHCFGFKTVGVIRGEAPRDSNPTLKFATACGMQLEFVSRTDYRQKETAFFQNQLKNKFGDYYLIPEGGTNLEALKGSAELGLEILQQSSKVPDEIRLCCGTGGTAAGLIQGLDGSSFVQGYSVLKGEFHKTFIKRFLIDQPALTNWQIHTNAHCGGYAKTRPELLHFIQNFAETHSIFLDPIYTGKLFYAFWGDLQKGKIKPGSSIVLVHSGGLQGVAGYNERFGTQLPLPD
ncbi:MAG: pyridoxal-phosphate dependent enzyme [Saprospiraceae bacterium]